MAVFKKYKHFRNAKACKKGAIVGLVALGALLVIFAILLILVVI
jgi:hypothetical protein